MAEELIGKVTHWFGQPGVGIVEVEAGEITIGDILHFKGATTDFQQELTSMEVEHERVEQAGPGQSVGLKVSSRVREGDEVFKVSEEV